MFGTYITLPKSTSDCVILGAGSRTTQTNLRVVGTGVKFLATETHFNTSRPQEVCVYVTTHDTTHETIFRTRNTRHENRNTRQNTTKQSQRNTRQEQHDTRHAKNTSNTRTIQGTIYTLCTTQGKTRTQARHKTGYKDCVSRCLCGVF